MDDEDPTPDSTDQTATDPDDPEDVVSSLLEVTVEADAVSFRYTIKNPDSLEQPFLRRFRYSREADMAVYEDEEIAWRWGEDKPKVGAVNSLKLDPGASVSYEFTWDHPEPGSYEAVARLEGERGRVPARETFTVEE